MKHLGAGHVTPSAVQHEALSSTRDWDEQAFRSVYATRIEGGCFLEEPGYYPRYRSRYRETLKYIWSLPLPTPARVADIGGGHFGVLLRELRGDDVTVVDVSDAYAAYLRSLGITHHTCDLIHDAVPSLTCDLVIVAEVIEHLSTPPHLALRKLSAVLCPGGYMLITTPNLFRLRNVVRLLQGRDYTARFHYPAKGTPIGHVMEYSMEHLVWQVEQAGLQVLRADTRHFSHSPVSFTDRALYWLGAPLLLRRRWRDQLVVVAQRPAGTA